jgi:hypothetical protein
VEVVGMKLQRKIYLARNQRYPATRAQSEFWEFVHQPKVEMVNHMSAPLPQP